MTLEIITADSLLSTRHGFFTRRGGASSGVFEGLNCGEGSSDQCDAVRINRARVAEAMGVAPGALITMRQVHSAKVAVIEDRAPARREADAMVTDRPGIALGILTADCQPVLFSDPEAGVIGAAHAGWKGALAGILEAVVDAMETLGARRERINAVIGPSISQRAYEVGPEFMETFAARDPQSVHHFARGRADRLHFDLPGYGLSRLGLARVAGAQWTRHCTYSDPQRFYSYRRSVHFKEADYGRLIAAIRL
ncbi:peptidoglycan editing factor PgeF [Profundibacterium mesophilum]|uniref:Purine nucleoside phosphorylase n=1 Tax=Profundibacterium mesophilum KAUST100406-0324 TaxID=1037889 RepID=A0A921NTQ2_9RHOB|nr:peptidoglycan editing factor PgeF [Profundibacterium mesophilum]KAF0675355.1 glutamate dehydrogenase [Profundibacterium mesophilum KAUST100406-0324]